jgi:aspartate/methionine/tyrosine aminotransferase
LIQGHQANTRLNAVTPSTMMRDLRDVSADELLGPLDERIIAGTMDALEAGQTHYVDVPGIGPLREALAQYLNGTFGSNLQTSNVVVTAGVQEARFLTIQMIGKEFGRIAIPEVVHPGVQKAIATRKIEVDTIAVDPAGGLLPTIDSIGAVLEAGARLVYLESPSRLTGASFTRDEVAQLADLLERYEASVIWDQGLAPWVADGSYASISAHASIAARTAVIGEAFPGMGLSSWYVGYIAAPDEWRTSMQSQKQIMSICTSTPTQYAALEASKLYSEQHSVALERLVSQRAGLLDKARSAGLTPIAGVASNVLAVRAADHDRASVIRKLEAAGFRVADGEDFGATGVLRFSVTATNAAAEALQQLV